MNDLGGCEIDKVMAHIYASPKNTVLQTKKASFYEAFFVCKFCGLDGTRTRDPMRDRHVF